MFVSDVFKLGVHWVCIKRSSLKSFCALTQKKGKLLAEEGNITKVPVHTYEERERQTDRQRQREKQMSSTLATTDNPICGLYFKDNVTYV